MRYTFQDSTALPVQRDFIQDLQDFVFISKDVLPLEKSAVKIKQENVEKTEIFQNMIENMAVFEKGLKEYIESCASNFKEDAIFEIKDATLAALSAAVLAKKDEKLEQLNNQSKLDLVEIEQLETRILTILSPFFENSIYGAKKAYYAFTEDKKLKGKQTSYINGMQCEFELSFTQDNFKVKDLQNLILPIWVKSGILSRETKVKKYDISDFYITSIECEANKLKVIIEDRDPQNKFVISANEEFLLIQHRDYEITSDSELVAAMNRDAVDSFLAKVRVLFKGPMGAKMLRKITYDGKNIFDNNRLFDCLKLIASIYGQLVAQCIEKGYTDGEITIKIEESGRIRTEKYLEKSEILSELSNLGNEGRELAAILKVTEV